MFDVPGRMLLRVYIDCIFTLQGLHEKFRARGEIKNHTYRSWESAEPRSPSSYKESWMQENYTFWSVPKYMYEYQGRTGAELCMK